MGVGHVLFGALVGAATVALAAGLYPVGATGAVALFLIAGNLAVALVAWRRIRLQAQAGRRRGPWTPRRP